MQITLTTLAPLQQSCEVNVMLPILPKQYAKLKLTQGPQAVVMALYGFQIHCVLSCFSHVQLFVTPWIVACQAPRLVGFSRQQY